VRNEWYQFRLCSLSPAAELNRQTWLADQPDLGGGRVDAQWWRDVAAKRDVAGEELFEEVRDWIDRTWRPQPPPVLDLGGVFTLLAPFVERRLRGALEPIDHGEPLDSLIDVGKLSEELELDPAGSLRSLLEDLKEDVEAPEWGATLEQELPAAVRACVRPDVARAVARGLRCSPDTVLEHLTRRQAARRAPEGRPGAGGADFLDQQVDYVTLTAVRGALAQLHLEAVGAAARALGRARDASSEQGELRDFQVALSWYAQASFQEAMQHLAEGDTEAANAWEGALQEPLFSAALVLSGFEPRPGPLGGGERAGFPATTRPLPDGTTIQLAPDLEAWIAEGAE